jgi:hypothetical protein
MSERGFIAVARGFLDHPVVGARKPYNDSEAWLWLLFEAAWKPQRVRVTNGRAVGCVTLERGQLTYSRSYLAKAWGWTEKRVRGFIFRLERDRQIVRQTGHLQTVITICNYELYQSPLSSKGQQADQQTARQRAGKGPEEEQGNKDNKVISGGGDAHAREPRAPISQEAIGFANELAQLCEQNLEFFGPQWVGAALRVQMMLDEGWPHRDHARNSQGHHQPSQGNWPESPREHSLFRKGLRARSRAAADAAGRPRHPGETPCRSSQSL